MLPHWVSYGPLLYWPLGAFLLSLTATWVVLRRALRPLRLAAPDAHWTERARLGFPARSLVPACLMLAIVPVLSIAIGLEYTSRLTVALAVAAGWLGVLINEVWMASAIRRSRVTVGMGLRGWAVLFLLLYPHLLTFFVLLPLMPEEMGPRVWILLGAGTLALLLSIRFSGIPVLRALGIARPASPRLQRIVDEAARRTGVRPAAVWELSWSAANAVALSWPGYLVFSEPVVRDFPEEEIAAIAVHEMSHLAEPRSVQISRTFGAWLLLPLAAVVPILDAYGVVAFAGVYAVILGGLLTVRRIAQRMEVRADALSREHQGEEGVYARALERIYQANQMPAVLRGGARKVHPNLYDRLLAAGVQPDYPRPAPPPRSFLLTAAAVVLFATGWLGLALALPPALSSLLPYEQQALLPAALWGSSEADLVGTLAAGQIEAGKTEEAIELLRAGLARHPDDVYLHIALAETLDHEERCEEARKAYADFQVQLAKGPAFEREVWQDSLPDLLRTCEAQAPPAR